MVAGCMIMVLAVLAAPVSGAMGPALGGVDITGNNIRMVVTGTKEACSAACDAEPACAAATFVLPGTIQGPDGHCYLKSASTPQTDNFNCYSFIKTLIQPVIACVMSFPKADFGATITNTSQPPRGFAPLTVKFADMSTGATAWSWDFGDGSAVSHGQNPFHTYTAGSPDGIYYDVTLTVAGSCPGETATVTKKQGVRVFDNLGFLVVSSTPAGAAVYVDGTYDGNTLAGTTGEPLHLTPGSHTIRLALGGYKDYTDTVTVVNGQVTTLSPVLENNPPGPVSSTPSSPSTTGSLQVTTLPDGAAVTVDSTPQGTTPVTIPGLTAGSHTVRLAKAGFVDYEGTLVLAAGKTTFLNITLVAAQGTTTTTASSPQVTTGTASLPVTAAPSGTGNLSVKSTPPGANVYLDGELLGTTPVRVPGVAPGTRRLLATLAGYNDISQTVEIAGGTENEVNFTFPAKKTPGFAVPVCIAALSFALLVLSGRGKGQ
ncbi:MAG: PEGA domain-containing protein [Methanoregula sp.]